MTSRPLRRCLDCPALSSEPRCSDCKRANNRAKDERRTPVTWRAWYSTPEWKALRDRVIAEEPTCMCDEHWNDPMAPASDVADHITPHKGDRSLFFDRENLQGLAKPCHDSKTAREDGGFGRGGRGDAISARGALAPHGGADFFLYDHGPGGAGAHSYMRGR